MSSSNKYKQRINTTTPGFFVILIDQSESMSWEFGSSKKDVAAADAVNNVLHEILLASYHGDETHDRCDIGVIGYGKNVRPIIGGSISEIEKKAEYIKTQEQQPDGTIIDIKKPIWVEPVAENTTPMDEAFNQAYNLVYNWTQHHPDSFPPIVINITDGMPNDLQGKNGDGRVTRTAAERLFKLGTNDGTTLLFNVHIINVEEREIILPHTEAILNDPYAKYLYNISSVIPKTLFNFATEAGFSPVEGARGMVFNASAETLIKMLNFGSTAFH